MFIENVFTISNASSDNREIHFSLTARSITGPDKDYEMPEMVPIIFTIIIIKFLIISAAHRVRNAAIKENKEKQALTWGSTAFLL